MKERSTVSKRDFLKISGVTLATAGCAPVVNKMIGNPTAESHETGIATGVPTPNITPTPVSTIRQESKEAASKEILEIAVAGPGIDPIIFFSSSDSLYRTNSSGNAERLLNVPVNNITSSPDGSRLAFTYKYDLKLHVGIIDANLPVPEFLGVAEVDGGCKSLTWSNDGKKIAYVARNSGTNALTVAKSDNLGVSAANTSNEVAGGISWSPDDSKLAYPAIDQDGSKQMYVAALHNAVRLEKGFIQPTICYTTEGENESPHWSPNGPRIAFVSTRKGAANLYCMPMNNCNLDLIRQGEEGCRAQIIAPEEQIVEGDMSWTRDGRHLAYSTRVEGEAGRNIHVVQPADPGKTWSVTGNGGENVNPAWSKDGMILYYVAKKDDEFSINEVDLWSSSHRELVRL